MLVTDVDVGVGWCLRRILVARRLRSSDVAEALNTPIRASYRPPQFRGHLYPCTRARILVLLISCSSRRFLAARRLRSSDVAEALNTPIRASRRPPQFCGPLHHCARAHILVLLYSHCSRRLLVARRLRNSDAAVALNTPIRATCKPPQSCGPLCLHTRALILVCCCISPYGANRWCRCGRAAAARGSICTPHTVGSEDENRAI